MCQIGRRVLLLWSLKAARHLLCGAHPGSGCPLAAKPKTWANQGFDTRVGQFPSTQGSLLLLFLARGGASQTRRRPGL